MADTKEFDVVRVARSDGADTGPSYWPASTASAAPALKKPVRDMAEKATRTKPQMVRLAQDDPRFVEWRIKLGILLKQELAPNPDEGHAWYVDFPRGYWLYERSKHLWVSGYPVKSKLYKSPQEFALHLIWLLSASNDYKDCCCVHCNASSIPKLVSAMEDSLTITPKDSPVKTDKFPTSSAKVTPVPVPAVPVHSQARPVSLIPPKKPLAQPVKQTVAAPAQPAKPASQSGQLPMQARQPTIPAPKRMGWGLKSSYLFRVGELVWYQNGATWRLGIIAVTLPAGHEILPLAYGSIRQANIMKSDRDMRPFYAFSVPPPSLQELKTKAFDEIPWDTLFQAAAAEPQRRDMLALDASKLAASKVDISFSLWGATPENPANRRTSYYGAFVGAERIEIGDTLRIRALPVDIGISAEQAVLGLYMIYNNAAEPGKVFFVGHIYVLTTPAANEYANFVTDDYLPLALRDEAEWRRQADPTSALRWALIKEEVTLEEPSIRGRYYPAQRLTPILHPAGWQQMVVAGQLPHLNTRLEGGSGRYIGRRNTRLMTFGSSVAHGARLALETHVIEEAA